MCVERDLRGGAVHLPSSPSPDVVQDRIRRLRVVRAVAVGQVHFARGERTDVQVPAIAVAIDAAAFLLRDQRRHGRSPRDVILPAAAPRRLRGGAGGGKPARGALVEHAHRQRRDGERDDHFEQGEAGIAGVR